jgi:hypothetical protein
MLTSSLSVFFGAGYPTYGIRPRNLALFIARLHDRWWAAQFPLRLREKTLPCCVVSLSKAATSL